MHGSYYNDKYFFNGTTSVNDVAGQTLFPYYVDSKTGATSMFYFDKQCGGSDGASSNGDWILWRAPNFDSSRENNIGGQVLMSAADPCGADMIVPGPQVLDPSPPLESSIWNVGCGDAANEDHTITTAAPTVCKVERMLDNIIPDGTYGNACGIRVLVLAPGENCDGKCVRNGAEDRFDCPSDAALGDDVDHNLDTCDYECEVADIFVIHNVHSMHTMSACGSGTASECAYVCEDGYFALGTATCVMGATDTEWANVQCSAVGCDANAFRLGSNVNASASSCTSTSVGSGETCTYVCDEGFDPLPGYEAAYCVSSTDGLSGEWRTACNQTYCDPISRETLASNDFFSGSIVSAALSPLGCYFGSGGDENLDLFAGESCYVQCDVGYTELAVTMYEVKCAADASAGDAVQVFDTNLNVTSPPRCDPVVCTFALLSDLSDAVKVYAEGGIEAPLLSCRGPIEFWDVSAIDDMTGLFFNLTTFNEDLSRWNVSKVTSMQDMFKEASAFTQDLNFWDVAKVTDMSGIFHGASVFDGNISSWNTERVTDLTRAFRYAENFNGDLPWNMERVVSLKRTFAFARNFNGNIDDWNTERVTTMENTFRSAEAFDRALDAWNTERVTTMYETFRAAEVFSGNGIHSWNVEKVTDMTKTFDWARLFNGDVSGWCVSRVETMYAMFYNDNLFNADISSWNVSKVTSLKSTFTLANIFNADISSWDTGRVMDMRHTFEDASWFDRDLDTWNTQRVTSLYETFRGATVFNGDISTWNVQKVTDLTATFADASAFNGEIATWNVEKVDTLSQTFSNCPNFNADLSAWSVAKVDDMHKVFYEAKSFNANLSLWNVERVLSLQNAFGGGIDAFDASELYRWKLSSLDAVHLSNSEPIFGRPNNILDCTKRQIYDSWHRQDDAITAVALSTSGAWDTQGASCALPCGVHPDVSAVSNAQTCSFPSNDGPFDACTIECDSYHDYFNGTAVAASCVSLNPGIGFDDAYCQLTCFDGGNWHPRCYKRSLETRSDGYYFCNCTSDVRGRARCDVDSNEWDFGDGSSCEAVLCSFDSIDALSAEVAAYVASGFSGTPCGGNIARWDVSKITSFQGLFEDVWGFNDDISDWDTSSATDLTEMFRNATDFNADVTEWNVAGVTSLDHIFDGASMFDQNLATWDVSKLDSMVFAFRQTPAMSNCAKRQIFDSWSAKSNETLAASMSSLSSLAPECATTFLCGPTPSLPYLRTSIDTNANSCDFNGADGNSCELRCAVGYNATANLTCVNDAWAPATDPTAVAPLCVRSTFGLYGFECDNGYGDTYDQIYQFAGTTSGDNRPYYRGVIDDGVYVYYDRACGSGAETHDPRWILQRPPDFDASRSEDIGCSTCGTGCANDLSWPSNAAEVPYGTTTMQHQWCEGLGNCGPKVITVVDPSDLNATCDATAVINSNYECQHDPNLCRLPNGVLDPNCGHRNGSCIASADTLEIFAYDEDACANDPQSACSYYCCDVSTSNLIPAGNVFDTYDVACEAPFYGGGSWMCYPSGQYRPMGSSNSDCTERAVLPNSTLNGPTNGHICRYDGCDDFECCCSQCAQKNCSEFENGMIAARECGRCDDVEVLGPEWLVSLAAAGNYEVPRCYYGESGMPDRDSLPACFYDCIRRGQDAFNCTSLSCNGVNADPCTWDCDDSEIQALAQFAVAICQDGAGISSLLTCTSDPIGVVLPDDALHGPANGGTCNATNCNLRECCCSECATRNCSFYESGETAVRTCGKCSDLSSTSPTFLARLSESNRTACNISPLDNLNIFPDCALDCVEYGQSTVSDLMDCSHIGSASVRCDDYQSRTCLSDCSQAAWQSMTTLAGTYCAQRGVSVDTFALSNCTFPPPPRLDTSCLSYTFPNNVRADPSSPNPCTDGIRLDVLTDRVCELSCDSGLVSYGEAKLKCFQRHTHALTSLKCCNATLCYENCVDYADCWLRVDGSSTTARNCSRVPPECQVCSSNCVSECDTSTCLTVASECETATCVPGVTSSERLTLVCGLVPTVSGHCTATNGFVGTCRASGVCEPSTVRSHFEIEYEVVDGDDYETDDPRVLRSFREVIARIVPCDEQDITWLKITRRELSADSSRGRRRLASESNYETFVLTFDVTFYNFEDAEDGAANVESAAAVVDGTDSEDGSELMNLLISSLTRTAIPDWTQQFYFRNDDCMWPADSFALISGAQISDLRVAIANASLPETCYRAEILSGHVINVYVCEEPADCSAKSDEIACADDMACVWTDSEAACSLLVNCTDTTDANMCNASATCRWDQAYGCTFREFVPLVSVRLSRATGDFAVAFEPIDMTSAGDDGDAGAQTLVVAILGAVGGLVLAFSVGIYWYVRRQQIVMQERRDKLKHALQATRRLNRRKARDIRMLQSAWEMSYDELELVQCLASKSTDSVWYATYKGFAVAVKISKGSLRSKDDEVFDESKLSSSSSSSSLLTSSTTMTSSSLSSKSERRPLNHEIKFLMRTRHERLNSFLGCGRSPEGDTFIVLEYAVGGSMDRWLWNRPMGGLPWLSRAIFLRDAASGLSFLHHSHQSIHRDIKSQNILICRENKKWRAKVADFGLSKIVLAGKKRIRKRKPRHHHGKFNASKHSRTAHWDKEMENFVGTPNWMAVELIGNASPAASSSSSTMSKYGPAVDVYSFACVIFETLAYTKPWDGLSRKEIFANVRRGLRPDVATAQQIDEDEEAAQIIPLMRACWAPKAADRPDMTHVLTFLKKMVQQLKAKREEDMLQREAAQTDRVAAAVRPSVESTSRLANRIFSSFNDDHPNNAFARADENKDGFLSFDEFSSWLSELSLQLENGTEGGKEEEEEGRGQARSAVTTSGETGLESRNSDVVIEMTEIRKV
eukprot:g3087.t1